MTSGAWPDRLRWLATALGAPDLEAQADGRAGRWRGRPGDAALLRLPPGAPHRLLRLQLLRHLLDRQPGGRWAQPAVAAALADGRLPLLARRLFLWLDGRRVDAQLARLYPGAAADRALDAAPRLPHTVLAGRPPGDPADAAEALALALQWADRLQAGQSRPSNVALRSATSWLQVQPAVGPGNAADPGAGTGTGMPGDGGGQAGVARSSGGPARMGPPAAPPPAGEGQAPSADTAPDTDGPSASGDAALPHRARTPGRAAAQAGAPQTTLHDEWDHACQAYRRHWTAVHERRLRGTDLQFMAGLQARFPALLRRVRRRIAGLQADSPQRTRHLADGDTIDLDAALDALADRRAGRPDGDGRLYQARPLRTRALSVALLLDTSSSTGYPLPEPAGTAAASEWAADDVLWGAGGSRRMADAAPRRRVLDVTRDAAALLCEALHTLGDRHAVFGFAGQGRLQVDLAVVKDFGEPWGTAQAAALAALHPHGATRTGAAVRHAAHRLLAEPARRRLLVVLSDGYPQDSDYGSGPGALEHALQDTAQALREAERVGVACLQVSVDAAAHDYLRRISPRRRYWVVDEVDRLPQRMLALARLLAGRG